MYQEMLRLCTVYSVVCRGGLELRFKDDKLISLMI